jgi:hypothetical protein
LAEEQLQRADEFRAEQKALKRAEFEAAQQLERTRKEEAEARSYA